MKRPVYIYIYSLYSSLDCGLDDPDQITRRSRPLVSSQ